MLAKQGFWETWFLSATWSSQKNKSGFNVSKIFVVPKYKITNFTVKVNWAQLLRLQANYLSNMPFERKWRLTPLHITFGEHNNKWPGILVTLIHYEIYSFSCPWYWHNLCWPLIQHIGSNYIFGFWLPSNLRIFFFCCFYEIEGETSNTMFGGKIEAVIWQTWSQAPSFP